MVTVPRWATILSVVVVVLVLQSLLQGYLLLYVGGGSSVNDYGTTASAAVTWMHWAISSASSPKEGGDDEPYERLYANDADGQQQQRQEQQPPPRLTIFSVLKEMDPPQTSSAAASNGCMRLSQEDMVLLAGPPRQPDTTQHYFDNRVLEKAVPCNASSSSAQVSWATTSMHHTLNNALLSWMALPSVDLILFGNAEACRYVHNVVVPMVQPEQRRRQLRVVCTPPPCVHPTYHVPMYDCIFAAVKEAARTEWIMYSNADMMYSPDLVETTADIAGRFAEFTVVGKRRDVWIPAVWSFVDESSWPELRRLALTEGVLHGKFGIDYFIFSRDVFPKMLPFIVGRVRWDNWLLAKMIANPDVTTVDATEAILAVHQNHMKKSAKREGTSYNIDLTQSNNNAIDVKLVGDIEITDVRIVPDNKKLTLKRDMYVFVDFSPEEEDDEGRELTRPLQVSTGTCALVACVYRRVIPPLTLLLYKHAHGRQVIFASVGPHDLDLATNWACHMDRIGLHGYIFQTSDVGVLHALIRRGLPAIHVATAFTPEIGRIVKLYPALYNSSFVWSTPFHEIQQHGRLEVAKQTLYLGIDVVFWDTAAIPMGNPLPLILLDTDIVTRLVLTEKDGKAVPADLKDANQAKVPALTGGFLFLRSSDRVKQYIVRVRNHHFKGLENLIAALKDGTASSKKMLEQGRSLEDEALAYGLFGDPQLTVSSIPGDIVADHAVFRRQFSLRSASEGRKKGGQLDEVPRFSDWPIVLHHTDIRAVSARRKYLESTGLWLLRNTAFTTPFGRRAQLLQCRGSHFNLPARPELIAGTVDLTLTLVLQIGTEHTLADVNALFDAILQADYSGSTKAPTTTTRWRKINLYVSVALSHADLDGIKSAGETLQTRWIVFGGDVDFSFVDDDSAAANHLELWRALWQPNLQREMALFLDPHHLVSPRFAQALLVLASEYYYNGASAQFDPHLFGISLLSRMHDVAFVDGNAASRRIGDKWVYRYQRMSLPGTAIFAPHYTSFIRWLEQHISDAEDGKPRLDRLINQCLGERGLYLLYAGSRFGPLVYRSGSAGTVPKQLPLSPFVKSSPFSLKPAANLNDLDAMAVAPLSARPYLDPVFDLLLLDMDGARMLPQQILESRALILFPHATFEEEEETDLPQKHQY